MKDRDWANLCRLYRERFCLKQDAFAYDFNVSQTTISRWETGKRVPGTRARQRILVELGKTDPCASEEMVQLALKCNLAPVALWDNQGRLLAMSPRFQRELSSFTRHAAPIGRHADDLTDTGGLMAFALDTLKPLGFFDRQVPSACVISAPIGDPRRIAIGGAMNISLLPAATGPGATGLLCFYEHDVLRLTPKKPRLRVLPDEALVFDPSGGAENRALHPA